MTPILTAITLGLMCGSLQAQSPLQRPQGAPKQSPNPRQIDMPHSGDPFETDPFCPGIVGPECAPTILDRPPRGGVSARTLAHKPSKAANRAFERAGRAWKKGQSEQSLRYLGEAVRLDPAFLEARLDLGAIYAKTNRPEEALHQYERALEIEPNLALLHSNKAAALVMLSRWAEAEQAARRALQLDSKSIDGNYMLGIAMLKQGRITSETAAHLEIAATKHPRARVFLAEVQAALAAEPRN